MGEGELPAKTLCGLLHEQCGWNKNTTYTILNSCVKKGLIERREPGFLCRPLVGREEVRTQELGHLVDGLFQGSPRPAVLHPGGQRLPEPRGRGGDAGP